MNSNVAPISVDFKLTHNDHAAGLNIAQADWLFQRVPIIDSFPSPFFLIEGGSLPLKRGRR